MHAATENSLRQARYASCTASFQYLHCKCPRVQMSNYYLEDKRDKYERMKIDQRMSF